MFSVIIPVYNGAAFVDTAIESVFAQNYTDWELIIVNDGSTDSTEEVLDKYKDNPKIKIITQKNAGVSVARNNGIKSSVGSYVVFLDADDVWHTNHLEVMNELVTKYPQAGLYGTFTRTELVNGDIIDRAEYFNDKEDVVLVENFPEEYYCNKSAKMFTVITTCFSRVALNVAGLFPEGCAIGEDLELSLRVSAYFPVVLSAKATATYKKVNSTATKDISFDPDWSFFETVQELYKDERIPENNKNSLKKLMNWFTMRRSRHYAIHGRKKEAFRAYFNIGNAPELLKDKLITLGILLMPSFVVGKIFSMRWRGRA